MFDIFFILILKSCHHKTKDLFLAFIYLQVIVQFQIVMTIISIANLINFVLPCKLIHLYLRLRILLRHLNFLIHRLLTCPN